MTVERHAGNHRGFSLTELLVVMLIIAVVIAIVLPALGGARNLAKNASTEALLRDLNIASAQFQQDNRTQPGYFPVRDLGSASNERRGMSAMENIMLSLAGGIVDDATPDSVEVGPYGGGPVGTASGVNVEVDPNLIGTEDPYFAPPAKFFTAQFNQSRATKQAGRPGHVDDKGAAQLPDIIDAFGQPVLVWQEDETAPSNITAPEDFVQIYATDQAARFYWASNSCFLKSDSLGKLRRNQVDRNSGTYSLIASTVRRPDRIASMAGILGNPNYTNNDLSADPYNDILPSASRGPIIFHSAGADGFYFGSKDRGAKSSADQNGVIAFGLNFMSVGNARYGEAPNHETIDVIDPFDDIVVSGGG